MKNKVLNSQEKQILRLIPVGRSRAIPIAEITRITGINARTVKDVVRTLVVNYEIPIIGARYGYPGYYIPETEEEQLEGVKPLMAQAKREMERVYKLRIGKIDNYKQYLEA